MDIKALLATTTRTTVGVVILSIAMVAGTANASGYSHSSHRSSRAVYDYARVVSAEPIIRYVTVTTPVKECWEETQYYTVNKQPANAGANTLFGAIIGGVIGHQFGSGHGKDVATVAGTLIGASIGNNSARKNGGYQTTEYSRPVTRCKTEYESREEERIDGYRVVYAYNGQKYSTRMPNDPGRRLRIKVDVRPAV